MIHDDGDDPDGGGGQMGSRDTNGGDDPDGGGGQMGSRGAPSSRG